ncbi:hypothetical protein HYH03_007223 [Edaphochlamys debaryana]|uniref:phytol kinase n=1 Tax=Edaphochlamys debaryana TaxID=47281 RepID=A0A836C0Q2_9CHLO|nr:hypothetical protein HYH03_007223 [Edaphochlamys debaryana]|eukprot:KAG2494709.1 hypothetical protein HYH03_007223 [Edaphochlamys debaryana]
MLLAPGTATALLQLVAFASRLETPRGQSEGPEGGRHKVAVSALALAAQLLLGAPSHPSSAAFVDKLLRMQTLQAAARQMAAAAQTLQGSVEAEAGSAEAAAGAGAAAAGAGAAVAGAGGAAAGPSQAHQRAAPAAAGPSSGPAGSVAAMAALQWRHERIATWLVDVMGLVSSMLECAEAVPDAARPPTPGETLAAKTRRALQESCLMDHAGRLLLLLLAPLPRGVQPTGAQCVALRRLVMATCNTGVRESEGDGASLLGQLARQGTLEVGIAVIAHMDKGGTYGVEHALLHEALTHGPQTILVALYRGAIAALVSAIMRDRNARRPCRLSRPGAVDLLLRLGRLVVASGSALEDYNKEAYVHGGYNMVLTFYLGTEEVHCTYAELLEVEDLPAMAKAILDSLLPCVELGVRAGAPERSYAEALGAWKLVLGVARHVATWASFEDVEQLVAPLIRMAEHALRPLLLPDDEVQGPSKLYVMPMPEHAPPPMAAAFEAGLLPCLERLLRRANRGPEAYVVLHFLVAQHAPRIFALLIAYAEARQAGLLLVTLAKALRHIDLGNLRKHPAGPVLLGAGIILPHSVVPLQPLAEAAAANINAGGAAPPTPLAAFVRTTFWLVLRLLLPVLSRAVQTAVSLVLAKSQQMRDEIIQTTLWSVATQAPLLHWVRDLAENCVIVTAPSDDDHGSAAGGTGLAPGDDSPEQGLHAFLLDDVDVVPLLGAVLRLTLFCGRKRTPDAWASHLEPLAGACCAMAAAWPEAVRLAAVRADDTADGSGGGPWWPEALRVLAWQLENRGGGPTSLSGRVTAVSAALEAGGVIPAGGDSSEELAARRHRAGLYAAALGRARDHLALCANPACVNLEGDSEADLKLQQCGRCGRVWYCCRECQVAHWKAGHKKACSGGHREG